MVYDRKCRLVAPFTRDVNMPTTHAYNVVPYPAPPRCFLLLATQSRARIPQILTELITAVLVWGARRQDGKVLSAPHTGAIGAVARATYIVQHVSAY